MKNNEILSAVAAVVTDKPLFTITVPVREPVAVKKRSLLDRLLSRPSPIVETERTFALTRLTVGNMMRIAGRSALLPDEIKEGSMIDAVIPLIHSHMEDIIYIIAVGIQNSRREPDEDLKQFIRENFDAEDIYKTLFPVLENIGLQSFMNSIALAKGTVKILEPSASPIDGRE